MTSRFRAFPLTCALIAGLAACAGVFAQNGLLDDRDEPESPLLKDPDTVEGAFEASLLMVDIARPKLARRYLELMVSLEPSDDDLLALREKHGAAAFLKLARLKELQPLSTELLDRVNRAFRTRAEDPTRIDGLISQLVGTPVERAGAILALRDGGPGVVPRMLERVGTQQFAGKRDTVVFTLTKLGPQVIPPLVAAVRSTDELQRAVAIEALGWTGEESVIPTLWYPAFSPSEDPAISMAARQSIGRLLGKRRGQLDEVTAEGVVRRLVTLSRKHLAMEIAPAIGEDGAERWEWLAEDGRVARVSLPPREAALLDAVRYAREALSMAPESNEVQGLFVAANTGLALERNGWDRGLPIGPGTAHDMALTAGEEVVSSGLQVALDADNAVAAMAMLSVLSEVGHARQVYHRGPAKTPLLNALEAGDPRVQFVAANTILTLDPEKPFPQSRRVIDVLVRAISDSGAPRVAIVDASVQRGRTMASLFGDLGFLATSVRTGKDGFKEAAEHADVELVAIESNVARWSLSQTIANFRADARTATTPIVVYSTSGRFDHNWVERIQRYQPIHFVNWSIRPEAIRDRIRPFVLAIRQPLTEDQRAEQTAVAVSWLAHIADGRRTDVFDITPADEALFDVAADPDLADDAILAIGAIPNAAAQTHLQELAVNVNNGAEVRRAAAVRLGLHVQRFGLLLKRDRVAELLQSWRDERDPATASRLAAVVGLLQPDAARVGERLLRTTPSPAASAP